MRIKKYTAATMKEALLQIKKELGDDAMILKTRKLPKKLFSLTDTHTIEVTAAIDDASIVGSHDEAVSSPPPSKSNSYASTGLKSYQQHRQVKNEQEIGQQQRRVTVQPMESEQAHQTIPEIISPPITDLHEDIRELKELVSSLINGSAIGIDTLSLTQPWLKMYQKLLQCGVEQKIASMILEKTQNSSMGEDDGWIALFSVLSEQFRVSGPLHKKKNGPLFVAFVGPTGAGKTTTIAKLAAYYSLTKKIPVSLVTADTYRIAAIEQLKAFADIIGIPLQVIFTSDDVGGVLKNCSGSKLVLIDTAGRSQNNTDHMEQLHSMLTFIKPDITSLVLSATTKYNDLMDTIEQYQRCSIKQLLFTKLDETKQIGNVFTAVAQSNIPVSYMTTGQNVPDDIELAQPARFVQRLMQETFV
ncbi:MAG: flagellar biosynthesis protein FlhF [Chitinivibrionales bacterium]|nr:flagellar biosynthesis protein FlhF [Chitinivibrionales bacterium]